MQRLCAAGLLHKGTTIICNPGKSNDDQAVIGVIKDLGASVEWKDDNLVINSKGVQPHTNLINCGESGLGIRMFGPIAALSSIELTITGKGTLNSRPMDFFDAVFPQLGVSVESNQGKLPITIKGPLVPGNITIDGSLSSQFLTGILFAFASSCTSPIEITVENLVSKPYIDLTLNVLKECGYEVVNHNYKVFGIQPPSKSNEPLEMTVEGDWSGAAFLFVAAAIAGNVVVQGLKMESSQADRAIIDALRLSGAEILINEQDISVNKKSLQSFIFDATDCPDLFPPLVALASFCEGMTCIKGVSRLKYKESDRAHSLQQEFAKFGVEIQIRDDEMLVVGGKEILNATVHSRHDHRIAMACATAALRAKGPVTILGAEAINKSYPDFYKHLKQLTFAP